MKTSGLLHAVDKILHTFGECDYSFQNEKKKRKTIICTHFVIYFTYLRFIFRVHLSVQQLWVKQNNMNKQCLINMTCLKHVYCVWCMRRGKKVNTKHSIDLMKRFKWNQLKFGAIIQNSICVVVSALFKWYECAVRTDIEQEPEKKARERGSAMASLMLHSIVSWFVLQECCDSFPWFSCAAVAVPVTRVGVAIASTNMVRLST